MKFNLEGYFNFLLLWCNSSLFCFKKKADDKFCEYKNLYIKEERATDTDIKAIEMGLYVIDMGVIAPTAWICLFQLKKRSAMGYILLELLLTVCCIIGIMIPIQSVFQEKAGISLPIVTVVTKEVLFSVLALFALYFNIRFFKSIKWLKWNIL